jgi:glucose/arabinose dehydrogenase
VADSNLQVRTIEGFSAPTQMTFIGDDDALVLQKSGEVMRVRGGEVEGPVITLKANYADERGLLGIALHPDFEQNHYVYLYWTWTGEGEEPDGLFGEGSEDIEQVPELGNRIDRFTWDGETLTFDRNIIQLASRTTDLTLDRRRGNHDGGVLRFGPDGKLYLVMGDQNARGPLQNVADGPPVDGPEDLLGVVIRLNDDGSTPDDNPFVSEGAPLDKVWVYGVRNSFGYDFDPETGDLWLGINGQASYDMLGRYGGGSNAGWIQLMGPPERLEDYKELESASERLLDAVEFPPSMLADSSEEAISRLVLFPGAEYVEPRFSWRLAVAPAAVTFLGDGLGPDYAGDILVGDVNTGVIYRFELTDDRQDLVLEGPLEDRVADNSRDNMVGELDGHLFGQGMLVATDIDNAPDGSVWIVSSALGEIYQVSAQ